MMTLICAALIGAMPADWMYPGWDVTSTGGSGRTHGTTAMTGDDFAAVVKYYEGRGGAVADLSRGRPLALRVITRRWERASIVLVVSRAEGEDRTHIALFYHEAGDIPPPEPIDWRYPRAIGRTTGDDFAAVAKYYQEKAGAIWEDGSLLDNGSITTPRFGVNVNDDSGGRPVALKMITRWWKGGEVSVVISRAKGEQRTYIDLISREPLTP